MTGPSQPRTSRGERTRTALLGAARDAFSTHGYTAVRVEDVVAAAGVSHGTFYTYFENKSAVLDALIDVTVDDLESVLAEPWEGPDGERVIERVIDRFVSIFGEHGDVMRVWFEAAAHDRHFETRLGDVRARYVRRVADGLAPALDPTPHDPAVAATALVAMVEGYATRGPVETPALPQRAAVRTLSTLWLGGLIRLMEDPVLP